MSKYEEGLEPLTSAAIREMSVGMNDDMKAAFAVDIGAAIERLVASKRVQVLVDENGDFVYELTKKGIRWAKEAEARGLS